MKDSVIIEGKIYISSRRAAEISRYSNDYIGQLCRAEKVSAKMVGRTWFIDEQSLQNHKNIVEESFRVRAEILAHNLRQQNQISSGGAVAINTQNNLGSFLILGSEGDVVKNTHDYIEPTQYVRSRSTTLVAALVAAMVFVSGIYVMQTSSFNQQARSAPSQLASLVSVPQVVVEYIFQSFGNISSIVTNYIASRTISFDMSGITNPQTSLSSNTSSSGENNFNGLAVTPAADTASGNEEIKQKIRDSFSDQVEVHPDTSGTAGVITPVFRKAKGNDFVYVLVPVQQNK